VAAVAVAVEGEAVVRENQAADPALGGWAGFSLPP